MCNKCNTKEYWYTDKHGCYLGPCKECLQKEIGYDIIKAIPYLDIFDLPYIPNQWEYCIEKAKKLNISSSFGLYLSYCKLASVKMCHFTDILIYPKDLIKKEEYERFFNELIKYINHKFNKQWRILDAN